MPLFVHNTQKDATASNEAVKMLDMACNIEPADAGGASVLAGRLGSTTASDIVEVSKELELAELPLEVVGSVEAEIRVEGSLTLESVL